MKIDKFVKIKGSIYKLIFEDKTSLLIHEDLILKYKLLLNNNISTDILNELTKENKYYTVYDLVLKYIGKKMRSSYEIEEYLKKMEVDNLDILKIKNLLIKQGYINDKMYCKCYINDRLSLSNDGPNKIIGNLEKLLIPFEIINDEMKVFDQNILEGRVIKLINKQIKLNHNKGNLLLKQKILNNLLKLGYDRELILQQLNVVNFNDNQLYKKEYDKLYKKLSIKYSGNELEYKIKEKMFQKGFKERA